MNIIQPKIIAIVGPTASGKTSLSIAFAKKYNGEIVSADSRQIYRGMDIGTAKPPISHEPKRGEFAKSSIPETVPFRNAERLSGTPVLFSKINAPILSEGVPHYLLDIKDPDEDYTVSDYKHDAIVAIEDIIKRNKLPILVGGTGLYIDTVIDNLDIPKIKADPELRATIEKDIAENGLATVFKKLVDRDPEAAYIVDPKNPRRVVRALEVAILTGEPFTAQRKKNEPLFDALKIGINPPPDILRQRINLRIDLMVQDGLVTEVETLIKKYGKTCVAFDAIGYREIIDYLDGKSSLEQATDIMKHNTWHYAKRQMTWFRKDKRIRWVTNKEEAERVIADFFENNLVSTPDSRLF